MKKYLFLIFIFLSLTINNCYTQNLTSLKYINLKTFSSNAFAVIEKYNDFKNLIKRRDTDVVFRRITNEAASEQKIELLFMSEGILYIFESHNYLKLDDYEDGMKLKITNGLEYYFYKSAELRNIKELEYFKYQPVLSDKDVRLFRTGGFKGASEFFKKEKSSSVYYPASVKKKDYDLFITLKLLSTMNINKEEILYRSDAQKKNIWLDYRNNINFILKEIKDRKSEIRYGKNKIIKTSNLNLPNGLFSKIKEISLEGYQEQSVSFLSDFEIFYFAQLNGMDNFTDYFDLCTMRSRGYKSLKDYTRAKNIGFADSSEFYNALERGFPDKKEYEKYSRIVYKYTDAEKIKNLRANLANINKKHIPNIKDPDDLSGAFILYCILKNRDAGLLSSEKIAEICKREYELSVFKDIKGNTVKTCDIVDRKIGSINSSIVHSFLEKIDVSKIGKYNIAGKVFLFNK